MYECGPVELILQLRRLVGRQTIFVRLISPGRGVVTLKTPPPCRGGGLDVPKLSPRRYLTGRHARMSPHGFNPGGAKYIRASDFCSLKISPGGEVWYVLKVAPLKGGDFLDVLKLAPRRYFRGGRTLHGTPAQTAEDQCHQITSTLQVYVTRHNTTEDIIYQVYIMYISGIYNVYIMYKSGIYNVYCIMFMLIH